MLRRHLTIALVMVLGAAFGVPAAASPASPAEQANRPVEMAAGGVVVPDEAPTRPRKPRRGRSVTVPPGPASPISPQIDSYYYALQHRQCAQLRVRLQQPNNEADALFAALADLCLGVKSRNYWVDWTAAEQAYLASNVLTDCLSVAARNSLGRALVRHLATGSARPSMGKAPKGTACQPQPTFVGVVSQGAGSTFLVLGLRLFEASKVLIDGVWHEATSQNAIQGTECARVDVPGVAAPQQGSSVSVQVRGPGYVTPEQEWTVGPAITEQDVADLDSSLCLPVPPATP